MIDHSISMIHYYQTGSKLFLEVEKIICNKLLLKDIAKLSPAEQTSSLEAFHNIVNFFAPKAIHYFYNQMKARVCLAALHFNANSSRPQATKDGEKQFRISFPKGRKGDAVPKEVKTKQNLDYVIELMEEVVIQRLQFTSTRQARQVCAEEMDVPPPSIASQLRESMGQFSRSEVIYNHCRRFNTSSYVRNAESII
ncbi:uncharacterized protein [Argopecten irradians]|uniref:uncharacterized protein n=1 Tax=Argopecten irradians TaxID=31199 RepID=UPI0037188FD1